VKLKTENAGHVEESLEERAEKLEAQTAVIAQKIAATRKNIDLANLRQANAPNEYALVAYDGVSGTTRRPIYIECTGQGFRFLPEGEAIGADDLEGFSDNFNPLLAGARTLIQFWSRRKRSGGPNEPEPYVLLLVRPSGCLTYYIARKSLTSLGALWGYELIEEDWKLSIPQADPVAKELLKENLSAVMQARRPQSREFVLSHERGNDAFDPSELFGADQGRSFGARADAEFGRGGGRDGGRPGVRQGYATRNDRGARLNPGEKSAGEIDIDDSRVRGGVGTADGWSQSNGSARTSRGTGGTGNAGGRTQAANMSNGKRSGGSASGSGTRTADATAADFSGDGQSRNGGTGGGSGGGPDETGSAIQAPPELAAEGSVMNSGEPGAGSFSGGKPGSRGGNRSGRARPATMGGASALGDGSDGPEGGFGSENAAGDDGSFRGGSGAMAGGDAGDDGLAVGAAGGDTLDPAGESLPNGGSSNSSAGSSGSSGNTTGNAAGNPPSSAPSWLDGSADDGSAGGNPMGGPGLNVRLGGKKSQRRTEGDDSSDGPRVSENGDRGGARGPANGPRKWGKVGRKAGIGFEKRIKIYLNDKRVVVDNKKHMMLLDPTTPGDELVNFAASSIDAVADNWGEPPSNFYWVPVVHFIIYPNGDTNYEKLRLNLESKWGVSSTVEYFKDKKDETKAGEPKDDKKKDAKKKAAGGGAR
jgi:hypothetical protein